MKAINNTAKTMEALELPLQPSMFNKVILSISHRKYECLLFSFLLLIFGDTFNYHKHIVSVAGIYQNFIVGLIIFYNKKWLRSLILSIIIVTIILDCFAPRLAFINMRSWHGNIYLIFFFLVATEVFKEVLYIKTVTRELLAAALCSFVLLCLISTFVFYQVDISIPHSFSNTGEGKDVLTNLNYFGFTTMLTIGYGDITPLSLVAKRTVMLMGLAGGGAFLYSIHYKHYYWQISFSKKGRYLIHKFY